jgi:hypothetical protein
LTVVRVVFAVFTVVVVGGIVVVGFTGSTVVVGPLGLDEWFDEQAPAATTTSAATTSARIRIRAR